MVTHMSTLKRPSWISTAAGVSLVAASFALAADSTPGAPPPAKRGPLFSTPLTDVPGKNLVVVNLDWDPKSPRHFMAHRHPGSVFVYVTKGTVRLGIEGQPVKLVHAGETFFEPPGAVHTVGENASTTEPAAAIAVMIVPDGAPLVTAEPRK
jgi:quercetin dioxygenase-like cupin family protein